MLIVGNGQWAAPGEGKKAEFCHLQPLLTTDAIPIPNDQRMHLVPCARHRDSPPDLHRMPPWCTIPLRAFGLRGQRGRVRLVPDASCALAARRADLCHDIARRHRVARCIHRCGAPGSMRTLVVLMGAAALLNA